MLNISAELDHGRSGFAIIVVLELYDRWRFHWAFVNMAAG